MNLQGRPLSLGRSPRNLHPGCPNEVLCLTSRTCHQCRPHTISPSFGGLTSRHDTASTASRKHHDVGFRGGNVCSCRPTRRPTTWNAQSERTSNILLAPTTISHKGHEISQLPQLPLGSPPLQIHPVAAQHLVEDGTATCAVVRRKQMLRDDERCAVMGSVQDVA